MKNTSQQKDREAFQIMEYYPKHSCAPIFNVKKYENNLVE